MNVRFTPEEMQNVNLTSLKLKDGSGYVGTFTVYHDVHCLVSQLFFDLALSLHLSSGVMRD